MGCGSSKPVEYNARVARVSKTDVTATQATYSWMCKPGSNEWEGEWRSGTSKDAPKDMGAESMLYSLVNIDTVAAPAAAPASAVDVKGLASAAAGMAGIDGAAEMYDAAKGALTKDGVKAKEEPQTMRSTYELRGKDGRVAWSFKLVDLTGTLDVKTLKGEKAVCAALTAPGRSVYKVVNLNSGSDVYKLAVYKTATAEADVSASDLVFDLKSNIMTDTWLLTAAPGGELVAKFVKPSMMQEETAPREATVGAGADLGLCLAILSAMQAWPVLEITPEKKNSLMPSYGEMLGIAAEAALG